MKSRTAVFDRMHHIEIITQLEDSHLGQLDELIRASTLVDGHEPIGEHKFLRMQHGDDLALGVLAVEDGRLVGYAHALAFSDGGPPRVSCELVVHPEARRRGIGGRLLAAVIEQAKRRGSRRVDIWAYNDSSESKQFAQRFGFLAERRLLHMHRHPRRPPFVPDPPGATIREFRPAADKDGLIALNNYIFAGHPENGAWTIEDLEGRMRQPWFRADDLLILEMEGQPAGFCWLKVEERGDDGKVGEVYVIGTVPERQGQGLGRYLLSRGLTHLHERQVDAVAVYVDQANTRGVALYWSLDFHHHHADVCYTLGLGETETQARPTGAAASE